MTAKVSTSDSFGIAVAVNQQHDTNGQYMTYGGFSEPSKSVTLPVLYSNWGLWNSGFMVQRAGDTDAPVYVTYYDAAGNFILYQPLGMISPNNYISVYVPNHIGSLFYGSAVITSPEKIVALGNATCGSCPGDQVFTYNGVNR